MNSPNPALVTHRAAQRLPRVALLLFCAAYVLPGLFGRDPWKNADITAFGYMVNVAEGRSPWFAPSVAGLLSDGALLPYWLGAVFVKLLGPWFGPALAARIPFALLLVLALVLTWYSTYYLARSDAAQPLPFAFGGEADPIDYARAIADGALLALIASLGLLQLGHETTPELAQLASVALFLYAMSASALRGAQARLAVLVALPALAASGAPSIALALGLVGTLVCRVSASASARGFSPWVMAGTALCIMAAWLLHAWGWRLDGYRSTAQVVAMLKELAWFLWPAWPLACWTLWRWREHLLDRHIAIPLSCAGVAILACVGMGGWDRALMLALPPLAVLAAFALPTLQRSTAAAIDWFSVFFFSVCALAIWVIYVAMQTGVPRQPAANVARLAVGFTPRFSLLAVIVAAAGTLAWLWLVKWRTGRHRHPLWKSLVLPASGVALCWLLLMTLWLPLLDYARSYRPLVQRIARHVPPGACVSARDLPRGQLVALEHLGGYEVDAATPLDATRCDFLLQSEPRLRPRPEIPGWVLVARERRPTDNEDVTAIYRRVANAR
ncbi:ArnT family glycosyltransferase [Piscinibacter sp.]|uniref:ArnT family glycosyltransferase n=1 Tax=Piscinibacter sp. TaxID=1903157 RepID=UPI00355970BA